MAWVSVSAQLSVRDGMGVGLGAIKHGTRASLVVLSHRRHSMKALGLVRLKTPLKYLRNLCVRVCVCRDHGVCDSENGVQ